MTERRGDVRHESTTYIKVFERKSGAFLGELANLSSKGAMFVTSEPISVRTNIQCWVKLTMTILGRDYIDFNAECCWSRHDVTNNRWESGQALTFDSVVDEEMISYLNLAFSLGHWGKLGTTQVEAVSPPNRRKAPRYVATEYFPVYEQNSTRQTGELVNLTTEGAALVTPEPIEIGTMIKCRAKLPTKTFGREYLFFQAECRWCKENLEKGCYDSGYLLMNVLEQDAEIILHLIIHVLKKQAGKQQALVM